MIITQLDGRSELLTDHSPPEIHERINGEYTLSFTVHLTTDNKYMYDMVKEESIVTCDDQQFVIKNIDENAIGAGASKHVTCEHIFFSLIDHRLLYEEYFDMDLTLLQLLQFIFVNNGFTYEVRGDFGTRYVEDIQPQNHLEFVNYLCDLFKVEIIRNNKHLVFVKQIGNITDKQIRYGHNLKTINRTINTNNLSTVIYGYMDGDMDLAYEYVSPLVNVYGRKVAEPVFADEIFEEEELMKLLKETIQDYPDISYTMEVTNERFNLGDTVYTIWEPLDIDIQTRVVEQTRYPENNIPPQVTIANIATNSVDILASFGKAKQNIDRVINDNGTINLSAMDAQVIRSTNAIMNSMTELEYPTSGGILARSKTDPGSYVIFNSGGFGIFKNGKAVEAITTDGFNLTAGVIGHLTAANIDATNLQVNAANITGVLTANQINAAGLKVYAADILGTLTANQIDVTNLNVYAANILGRLQANQIETSQLIVGNNVAMGPNAYLSWSNVYGAPTIPTHASQIGAMPTATYIDANGIFTGKVYANYIQAGTVRGLRLLGSSIETIPDDKGFMTLNESSLRGFGNDNQFSFTLQTYINPNSGRYEGELTLWNSRIESNGSTVTEHINLSAYDSRTAMLSTSMEKFTIGGLFVKEVFLQGTKATLNGKELATQEWVQANFVSK